MEKELIDALVVANAQDIEHLQERHALLEAELARLRESVRTAFAQAGIEFDKSGSFVSSRVPTLEVPVTEPTTPISINRHLRPSRTGIIGVPSGDGGDGASRTGELS